jgi:hypothetical protein
MNVIVDQPIPIIETKYIVKYSYYLYNLILNQEVTIIIDYQNSQDIQVYQSIIKLTGEQYTAWGSDDTYIVNIVSAEVDKLRKTGINIIEVLPSILVQPEGVGQIVV